MEKRPDFSKLSSDEKTDQLNKFWDTLEIFKARIESLEAEVRDLKGKLALHSKNSSKPPSSDGPGPKPAAAADRSAAGRSSGGQPGHFGATLMQVAQDRIDEVVLHGPAETSCVACGKRLPRAAPSGVSPRQVLDLPRMAFEAVEHRIMESTCRCGKIHRGEFPEGVAAAVQYGPGIKAAAALLCSSHMVSQSRAAELLRDMTGLAITQGTVASAVAEAAVLLAAPIATIGEALLGAHVAHADETGAKAAPKGGGKPELHWIHSLSTPKLTHLAASIRRGQAGMAEVGLLPRFSGVLVHDGLAAYWSLTCRHALCNAHHLRELAFVRDEMGQPWAGQMAALLGEACHAVSEHGGPLPPPSLAPFTEAYRRLVEEGLTANPRNFERALGARGRPKQNKARLLLERLDRRSVEVWRFAVDPGVPFTNNTAERTMRMPKVKQKVSGCFRSLQGLIDFCMLRSYADTLKKNGMSVYAAMRTAFQGGAPPLPDFA